MTAQTQGRKASYRDATPLDNARALVRDELRRSDEGEAELLSSSAWRHIGTVKILVYRDERSVTPRSRDDIEVALEYLVEKGLVEAEVPEGAVSETRPQTYRWARSATSEALRRFVATNGRDLPTPRVAADDALRCAAPGCRNERLGGTALYCSQTCNQRAFRLRQAARARDKRTQEAS